MEWRGGNHIVPADYRDDHLPEKDEDMDRDTRYKIAGHPENILRFSPGISICGDINDGVSFTHGENGGCWVVSFRDFEDMYLKAKALRESEKGRFSKSRLA